MRKSQKLGLSFSHYFSSSLVMFFFVAQFFGEVSLLQGIKRTMSAKAKTQCLLFQIGKRELLSVLQDFPEVEKFLNGVASSRRRRVHHFVHPSDNPISEQENYDSEDQRTEVFLHSKDRRKVGSFDISAPDVAMQR
jgi:CRP-like cAMP-binding protein